MTPSSRDGAVIPESRRLIRDPGPVRRTLSPLALDPGSARFALGRDDKGEVGSIGTDQTIELEASGSAEAMARQKAEAAELQRLRRENARLKEENEILHNASAFLARRAGKT